MSTRKKAPAKKAKPDEDNIEIDDSIVFATPKKRGKDEDAKISEPETLYLSDSEIETSEGEGSVKPAVTLGTPELLEALYAECIRTKAKKVVEVSIKNEKQEIGKAWLKCADLSHYFLEFEGKKYTTFQQLYDVVKKAHGDKFKKTYNFANNATVNGSFLCWWLARYNDHSYGAILDQPDNKFLSELYSVLKGDSDEEVFMLEYPGLEQKIEFGYDPQNDKHFLAFGNLYFSTPNYLALYLGTGKCANPSGAKKLLYNGKTLRDYLPKKTPTKGKPETEQASKKQKVSPSKPDEQKRYTPARQNSFSPNSSPTKGTKEETIDPEQLMNLCDSFKNVFQPLTPAQLQSYTKVKEMFQFAKDQRASQKKHIALFGMQSAGKSYLANILIGHCTTNNCCHSGGKCVAPPILPSVAQSTAGTLLPITVEHGEQLGVEIIYFGMDQLLENMAKYKELLVASMPEGSIDNVLTKLGKSVKVPGIKTYSDVYNYLKVSHHEAAIDLLAVEYIRVSTPHCPQDLVITDLVGFDDSTYTTFRNKFRRKSINMVYFVKREMRTFVKDEMRKLMEYGFFEDMYMSDDGFLCGLPTLIYLHNTLEDKITETVEQKRKDFLDSFKRECVEFSRQPDAQFKVDTRLLSMAVKQVSDYWDCIVVRRNPKLDTLRDERSRLIRNALKYEADILSYRMLKIVTLFLHELRQSLLLGKKSSKSAKMIDRLKLLQSSASTKAKEDLTDSFLKLVIMAFHIPAAEDDCRKFEQMCFNMISDALTNVKSSVSPDASLVTLSQNIAETLKQQYTLTEGFFTQVKERLNEFLPDLEDIQILRLKFCCLSLQLEQRLRNIVLEAGIEINIVSLITDKEAIRDTWKRILETRQQRDVKKLATDIAKQVASYIYNYSPITTMKLQISNALIEEVLNIIDSISKMIASSSQMPAKQLTESIIDEMSQQLSRLEGIMKLRGPKYVTVEAANYTDGYCEPKCEKTLDRSPSSGGLFPRTKKLTVEIAKDETFCVTKASETFTLKVPQLVTTQIAAVYSDKVDPLTCTLKPTFLVANQTKYVPLVPYDMEDCAGIIFVLISPQLVKEYTSSISTLKEAQIPDSKVQIFPIVLHQHNSSKMVAFTMAIMIAEALKLNHIHVLDASSKMKVSEWIHIGWNKQISLARPLVRLQDILQTEMKSQLELDKKNQSMFVELVKNNYLDLKTILSTEEMFTLFKYINPNTPEERWKAFTSNIDEIIGKLPDMPFTFAQTSSSEELSEILPDAVLTGSTMQVPSMKQAITFLFKSPVQCPAIVAISSNSLYVWKHLHSLAKQQYTHRFSKKLKWFAALHIYTPGFVNQGFASDEELLGKVNSRKEEEMYIPNCFMSHEFCGTKSTRK